MLFNLLVNLVNQLYFYKPINFQSLILYFIKLVDFDVVFLPNSRFRASETTWLWLFMKRTLALPLRRETTLSLTSASLNSNFSLTRCQPKIRENSQLTGFCTSFSQKKIWVSGFFYRMLNTLQSSHHQQFFCLFDISFVLNASWSWALSVVKFVSS